MDKHAAKDFMEELIADLEAGRIFPVDLGLEDLKLLLGHGERVPASPISMRPDIIDYAVVAVAQQKQGTRTDAVFTLDPTHRLVLEYRKDILHACLVDSAGTAFCLPLYAATLRSVLASVCNQETSV